MKRCILRSRRRVGWCEFSARSFFHRPLSRRRSSPSSRAAEPYDRKSSVTNRSGAKAYLFRSLRINFSAACMFRFDWTRTSRTSPAACRASDAPGSARVVRSQSTQFCRHGRSWYGRNAEESRHRLDEGSAPGATVPETSSECVHSNARAEALHERRPRFRNTNGVPSWRRRFARKAVARQRRNHEMESIGWALSRWPVLLVNGATRLWAARSEINGLQSSRVVPDTSRIRYSWPT